MGGAVSAGSAGSAVGVVGAVATGGAVGVVGAIGVIGAGRAGSPARLKAPGRPGAVVPIAVAGVAGVSGAATATTAVTAVTVTRWTARLLVAAGAAMLPWLVYLAATLPGREVAGHWDVVWVGLDTAEMAGLVATGLLVRAGDARRALTGMVTATLLAADAWFDCGTATTAGDRVAAFAMAAGAELPLAALLAVLAWRAFPKGVSA